MTPLWETMLKGSMIMAMGALIVIAIWCGVAILIALVAGWWPMRIIIPLGIWLAVSYVFGRIIDQAEMKG